MSAEYQDRTGSGMRVSDAEREATAAELREHFAAGRLTLDELNERINKAFAATTRGDLSAIMHDLPSHQPGSTPLAADQPSSGAGWSGQDWGRQDWGQHGWGQHGWGQHGWRRQDCGGQAWHGPGRVIGSFITTLVAVGLLAWVGMMAVWGFGGGSRPVAIGLVLAAFALLRRLFFGRRGPRRARRASARRGRPRRRF